MSRRRRPLGLCSALCVLTGILMLALPVDSQAADPSVLDQVFGRATIRSDNLALFPKWRGALARHFDDRPPDEVCSAGSFDRCDLAEWEGFLYGQAGRDPQSQIDAVNRYMNEHRYVIDPRNWGVEDYWATPGQFFDKDGDCEDYAIAKFLSLRALGWPGERLRIVIVNDLNLRVQHAVLVVELEGSAFVLDNQIPAVMPAERIRHYSPVYSLNEESWWLHRT
ncbi:MAG: transglutaminase-like cysteine peptidase [Tistlia sp.]|uniref:transglutaminase-like cysteine peptidase n=1 Tax=Tistlia sp. TaxID=3057121 RepID=UPI0034A10EE2